MTNLQELNRLALAAKETSEIFLNAPFLSEYWHAAQLLANKADDEMHCALTHQVVLDLIGAYFAIRDERNSLSNKLHSLKVKISILSED